MLQKKHRLKIFIFFFYYYKFPETVNVLPNYKLDLKETKIYLYKLRFQLKINTVSKLALYVKKYTLI